MNNNIIHFTETQKFSGKLVWSILILTFLTGIFFPLRAWYYDSQIEMKHLVPLFISIVLIAFFMAAKLETRIEEETIQYRFFPFQFSFRRIKKGNIKNIDVIHYDPLSDYGGWGIRIGRKGWAYNVKGNLGISIEFTNGKHILIGTQEKKERLTEVLKNNYFSLI